jgi:hypothetical protein
LNFIAASCNNGDDLYCIDLLRGDQIKVIHGMKEHQRGAMLDPVMAPNGQYLLTRTNGGQLLKWVCGGGTFECTEQGPRLGGDGPYEICISWDSSLACLPTRSGNNGLDKDNCTAIQLTRPLKQRMCVLEMNGRPMPVGFDPTAQLIYSGNPTFPLMVFHYAGTRLKQYKIGNGDPRQFLVHPDGKKFVLLQTDQVSLVELKK